MSFHPEPRPLNRLNSDEISRRIRYERAGMRCEWCAAHNHKPHPLTGSRVVLTVAHIDHNPANNAAPNLAAICQRCHNTHDGHKRVQNRKHRAHPSRPDGAAVKTLLIAAALLLAACAPPQAGHAPQATTTPTLANIASWGRVTVSDGSWNMRKAVDNDIDTWWSADNTPPVVRSRIPVRRACLQDRTGRHANPARSRQSHPHSQLQRQNRRVAPLRHRLLRRRNPLFP